MAALAASLAWEPSEVNHVLHRRRRRLGLLAGPGPAILRAAAAADGSDPPLHDQEFPASYAPVEHLLPDQPDGKYHVVVAEEGGVRSGTPPAGSSPTATGTSTTSPSPTPPAATAPAATSSSPSAAGWSRRPAPTTST